jgi:putative protease
MNNKQSNSNKNSKRSSAQVDKINSLSTNKNRENMNKPELLAPAGNLQSAVIALDSGADAVYIGMQKFNARERAENFNTSDASKLINYAHKNNKKVYITFNTLIKESELSEVMKVLCDINELQPDAVIIQDLGIANLIRKYFPTLNIHASTQMAIHNTAGIKQTASMGISRVILERQVMYSELKEIMQKNNDMEIEVFVQGALCCSLSGQCLFSSWIGGRSGNRGKCTQPCRRRFYSENGNGFFFSTKDLATLEDLPKLIKLGIASFKIEGRLKKPDYIKNVITAFRLIIDASPSDIKDAMKDAKEIMRRVAGRSLSGGFSTKHEMENLIEHKKMGVTGIYCGKVIKTTQSGFYVDVSKKIHIGDILRLQEYAGDNSSALAVSYISVKGQSVQKAVYGEECFIKCDRQVPQNASVYKTGESYTRLSARLKTLTEQKKKINLKINISNTGFTIKTPYGEWEKTIEIAQAQKFPLNQEKIIKAFMASGNSKFEPGTIDVKITGDLFLPDSVLKKIKREFWSYFEELHTNNNVQSQSELILNTFNNDYKLKKQEAINAKKNFPISLLNKSECGKDSLPIEFFNRGIKEIILPSFCPENKLKQLTEMIKKVVAQVPLIKIRITSIYQIEILNKLNLKNIEIIVSYPCPVCNSYTIDELQNLISKNNMNLIKVQAWVELEEKELINIKEYSHIPLEIFASGRVPLMSTRASIPVNGIIHDDRGAEYIIEKDDFSEITYIYSNKLLNIPRIEGTAVFATCKKMLSKKLSTSFNFNREF